MSLDDVPARALAPLLPTDAQWRQLRFQHHRFARGDFALDSPPPEPERPTTAQVLRGLGWRPR